MKRRRRRGERFSDESVDPMNYVSNLSDAMPDGASAVRRVCVAGEGWLTPEELEQMDSTEGETDEGMEKLGEVYYDAETGKYYIIENGN